MADYNSNLPVQYGSGTFIVLGSINVNNPVVVGSIATQTVLGSVAITTTPVPVSGTSLLVSGAGTFTVAGSVGITTGSLSVYQSTAPWNMTGSVTLYGGSVAITTTPLPISGAVNIPAGSVIVTNTVLTIEGLAIGSILYNTATGLAAGGSNIQYYVSTGSFAVSKVIASASGKLKAVVGTGSPGVTAFLAGFNSTANPNIEFDIPNEFFIGSNSFISVIRENRELVDAMDVYSTIIGRYL